MEYILSLIFLLVLPVAAQTGGNRCRYMPPTVCISQDVNVTLGNDFNLNCTFYTNVQKKCYWKRNKLNAIVTGRYSDVTKHNTSLNNTQCSLKVTGVQEIDKGNWTCGILADADGDGVTSERIKVNVLTSNIDGFNFASKSASTSNNPGNSQSAIGSTEPTGARKENPPQSVINNITYVQNDIVYIVIGLFSTLILLSILGIITWYLIKHKKKIKGKSSPSPSLHDYEEIDENAISFDHDQVPSSCKFTQPLETIPTDGYKVASARNNPKETIKVDICNQRSSKFSNQNIVTIDHDYQNMGPNF